VTSSVRHHLLATCATSALLLLFSCVGIAGSQNQDPTVIVNVRILPQDGPVRLLGMRLPGAHGRGPLVHVLNTSSTKAAEVWVEAIMSGVSGIGMTTVSLESVRTTPN
jgi:hypothetical protein